jgi:uncharacterized RDD family membrane protein YckC
MFCPRCGREATPDASFCSSCGARLPVAAAATAAPPPAAPEPSRWGPARPSDPSVLQTPHPEAPAPSTGDPATEPLSDPLGGAATEAPLAPAAAAVPTGWQPAPAWQPPPVAASIAPAAEVRYGGFWRRFGAFLIDGMLLWIAGALLRLGMGVDVFATDWQDTRSAIASMISLIGGWTYCAILESSPLQGTLGQRAAGLKVTDLALRRISFMRATGRHFGQLVSAITLGFGYLMIAFTAKKQGLHDIMAGCLVLRAD